MKDKEECRCKHGMIKEWCGYGQIGAVLNLHPTTISNALNGWSISDETESKLKQLAMEIKMEIVNA